MRYNTQTGTYSRDDGDAMENIYCRGNPILFCPDGRRVRRVRIERQARYTRIHIRGRKNIRRDGHCGECVYSGQHSRKHTHRRTDTQYPDILIPFASVDPDNIFVSLTEPLLRPDANLIISDGLLTGIYAGTEVSELLSRFTGTLTLYSADGKEKSTGQVCTGDFLKSPGGRITLAVKGDVDGNGKLTATDYLLIKRYVLGISQPTEEKYEAAKVAGGSRLVLRTICCSSAPYLRAIISRRTMRKMLREGRRRTAGI